jgi:hypothetical protein
MVRFEPTRRTLVHRDLFVVMAVKRYEKDRIIVSAMGREMEIRYTIKDGILTQTDKAGSQRQAYRRLTGVPPEFELKPLALGKPGPVAAEKVKEIQGELARRLETDQAVRRDMNRFQHEGAKVDAENTKYVKSLVATLGWLDAERFGREAANAAFLLVQHSSDLRLMMAALPEIKKDLKAKRVDPQDYALLFDRIQTSVGEKQRYGTQLGQNEKGELIVFPLEDRKKVEEFRKEIGLFPLSQYLGQIKQMTGKDVKFADE